MNEDALAYMESFYMALADKTRLRILNLIRDQEVCVYLFTEVLGESQPKISRHLAYLRGAGLVTVRREGKWMHYSIAVPSTEGGEKVLANVLNWLDDHSELRKEWSECQNTRHSKNEIIEDAQIAVESEYENRNCAHTDLDEFLL